MDIKNLIDVAARRKIADLVIKNAKIVDVYSGKIIQGDVAITDGYIAGIGEYDGIEIIDVHGSYVSPGFIDGHIHIESSHLTPEEFGRLLVPLGCTCVIADPHEIVNVAGLKGFEYMLKASERTKLDIKYMLPSCVPATPFENSGARVLAKNMLGPISKSNVLGLAEYMNFPGVINANDEDIAKIEVARKANKIIDGHSPGLFGKDLNAYIAAGIHTDHECSRIEEMNERISRGMYVLIREGSACKDLSMLAKGITEANSRRCLLCSDDRQPKTIFEKGHIDNHLRMLVKEGIDPIIGIQMATLNAAECYRLNDRGAIAPGLRADITIFNNLEDFNVEKVIIKGELVAENGVYLSEVKKYDISEVRSDFKVKNFSKEKLKMKLKNNKVNVIEIEPGGVLTKKKVMSIEVDDEGEFVRNPEEDLLKITVVERHKNTGNVGLGFLKGYGLKKGAIAISIAHDSHNIIAVGVSDVDIEVAVKELVKQDGGIVLVDKGKVEASLRMEIAGIMSGKDGRWVEEKLREVHEVAHEEFGVDKDVDPIMTLCFMSLPVIPEIKITDKGLFDVGKFDFITIESE